MSFEIGSLAKFSPTYWDWSCFPEERQFRLYDVPDLYIAPVELTIKGEYYCGAQSHKLMKTTSPMLLVLKVFNAHEHIPIPAAMCPYKIKSLDFSYGLVTPLGLDVVHLGFELGYARGIQIKNVTVNEAEDMVGWQTYVDHFYKSGHEYVIYDCLITDSDLTAVRALVPWYAMEKIENE